MTHINGITHITSIISITSILPIVAIDADNIDTKDMCIVLKIKDEVLVIMGVGIVSATVESTASLVLTVRRYIHIRA